MIKLILIIVALAFSFEAGAQAVLSPYSQWINSSYKAADTKSERSRLAARSQGMRVVNDEVRMRAFLHVDSALDRKVLTSEGVTVVGDYEDILSVEFSLENMEAIASLKGVERIEVAQPVWRQMEKARPHGGVDAAHQGVALPQAFTGKGVIVGVVDQGFEYGHPHLYSTDKSSYRVKRVWNMNASDGEKLAVPFNKGSHYMAMADILAAQYDTEREGETHGMHVVGIAAGADNSAKAQGVAPESEIVLVTPDDNDSSSDNVAMSNAIKYIYDYADAQGKPAVVNLSWGSPIGPHDGTSGFDRVCERLIGAGKLLVGAAGNSGDEYIHLGRDFSANGESLRSVIKFDDPENKLAFVDVYGDETNDFKVDVSILNSEGQPQYVTNALQGRKGGWVDVDVMQGGVGKIQLYSGLSASRRRGNVLVIVELDYLDVGNAVSVRITPVNKGKGVVNAWSARASFASNSLAGHVRGDTHSTVSEIGGTGKGIISVGAFVGRDAFKTLEGEDRFLREREGQLCSFSGKGPTADGRVKPDVCAPGSMLISSYSRVAVNPASEDYEMVTHKVEWKGRDYYYGAMQGTSMAAPFVTGVLALWLEAAPELTPEEALSVIQATTRNDVFTGNVTNVKSPLWGYGKIDAAVGLQELFKRKEDQIYAGGLPVVVRTPRSMGNHLQVQFLAPVSGVRFKLYNAEGRLLKEEPHGTQGDEAISLALPTVARGLYVLRVEADQGVSTVKLVIPSGGE